MKQGLKITVEDNNIIIEFDTTMYSKDQLKKIMKLVLDDLANNV